MEAPKELYVRESIHGSLGVFTTNVSDSVKYLRSDLAVDREKLVEWLEEQMRIIREGDGTNGFGLGKYTAYYNVIEKLKEL